MWSFQCNQSWETHVGADDNDRWAHFLASKSRWTLAQVCLVGVGDGEVVVE